MIIIDDKLKVFEKKKRFVRRKAIFEELKILEPTIMEFYYGQKNKYYFRNRDRSIKIIIQHPELPNKFGVIKNRLYMLRLDQGKKKPNKIYKVLGITFVY